MIYCDKSKFISQLSTDHLLPQNKIAATTHLLFLLAPNPACWQVSMWVLTVKLPTDNEAELVKRRFSFLQSCVPGQVTVICERKPMTCHYHTKS